MTSDHESGCIQTEDTDGMGYKKVGAYRQKTQMGWDTDTHTHTHTKLIGLLEEKFSEMS